MKKILTIILCTAIVIVGINIAIPRETKAQQSLFIAYPPPNHQTRAEQIFLIGSAPSNGEVLINGMAIDRSPQGHFAPSFPLEIGQNNFVIKYQNREIQRQITRIATTPNLPIGVNFGTDSLTPKTNISRLPNELICFSAIAPNLATVSVQIAGENIPLLQQEDSFQLPPNNAVLTEQNLPNQTNSSIATAGKYQGCTRISQVGNFGNPRFQLSLNGQTINELGQGTIEILSPTNFEVIEVIKDGGIARTGPSTNYSRLTPLPQGTRASIIGKESEWLHLDYGGWIKAEETRIVNSNIPPRSIIRSITSRQTFEGKEIVFPLEIPVPISIEQGDNTFKLNIYNTTAQTDTIRLDDDPIIKRLDWQQLTPNQIQYTFHLKSEQQWGYDVRYEGSTLILTFRDSPQLNSKSRSRSLQGISILIDPGHGGEELGARGPTGYPEKDVNLIVSKLLQTELINKGATVHMTRETDKFVSLQDRVEMINNIKPTLAFSVHYNALPDSGDAINTDGIGMFWYHPQAHDLSIFLQNYLVQKLNRPSYGVFWNNLALTRPHTAPTVLLELGFMINPDEFEWITNPAEQQRLAKTLADGISEWLRQI